MAGIQVSIGADSRKAARELESFKKKTKGIAASIAKGFKERVGHRMFDGMARAAASVPDLMMGAINSASDLNEELGKSVAVFGEHAKQLKSWSKTTADSFGVSRVMALEATGTMGNMLSAFGITGGKAAEMSRELVELAADMGSFNNASIEETIFAIGAALRGENEPIRKFGVALDDARLKAKALELGLYSGKGSLDANAKAMASYALIIQQTSIQQGNFADTADDLANSKKRLQAKFEDLKAVIGESLLPVVKDLISTMQETDFKAVGDSVASLAGVFASLVDYISKAHEGWVWFKEDLEKGEPFGFNFTKSLRKLFGMESKEKLEFSPASDDPDAFFKLPANDRRKKELEEAEKAQREVDKANAKFREDLKKEEERGNRIRDAKQAEAKKRSVINSIRDEYKNTLRVLDARIKGDDELLKKEKLRKDVLEEQKKSASGGFILDFKSAEKIVLKRREAEEAEKARDAEKEKLKQDKIDRIDKLEEEVLRTENALSSSSRSSLSAVSSMQRVGGGGGVYGELDLQRRQTDLQSKMVSLLEDLKKEVNTMPLSEF